MATVEAPIIPSVPFGSVAKRINRLWDPFERPAHIAVFGVSGAGKSHLIRHGLLPVRNTARTVIIDMKSGRDQVWDGCGTPVEELPPAFFGDGDGPAQCRYRLIVNRSEAKTQVRRALEQIRDEGHCLVVIDETRSITEREQAGLSSVVENLVLEGRGLGISMILGAQSLAWAVSALRDQPTTTFVGMTGNMAQARELSAIVGQGRELAPTIKQIPGRTWLYADRWEGEPLLGMTRLERPARDGT